MSDQEEGREQMSGQESTGKTARTLKTDAVNSKAGIIIRPNEKVPLVFAGSPFHKDGHTEDVHPNVAAKLIDKGYAKLSGEATPEQKNRLAEFKPADSKSTKKEK